MEGGNCVKRKMKGFPEKSASGVTADKAWPAMNLAPARTRFPSTGTDFPRGSIFTAGNAVLTGNKKLVLLK